ncbi:MinD/ParA family protein [Planctomycetota bacterium]
MTDQAEQLRSLVEQASNQQLSGASPDQILVVAGAQSGVGTTTLAANLAIAVARCNTPTVLVDMNFVRPQIAAVCRVRPRYPLTDLLQARRQVREVLQPGPCGVQVLPGQDGLVRNHESATMVASRIIEAIKPIARSNVIVIDAGADYSVGLQALSGVAQQVVFVTNEDTPTVMDCYALIKRLCSHGTVATLASLVNFASRNETARDIHARLAVSCDRFLNLHLECAGTIQDDRRVHDANCAGRPFVVYAPQSEAASQINLLAERFAHHPSNTRTIRAA